MDEKKRNAEIMRLLEEAYPDAAPQLVFSNPFELLIATMLSAQCTDKQVNKCTAPLFRDHPNAASISSMSEDELNAYIKPCGLYKTKCRHILETCAILVDKYGGNVPGTREELMSLPGVGRKTANVVLSNAFFVPAIAVDTHVARVSNRLGLADSNDTLRIELSLNEKIPREKWSLAHHLLIFHGRRVCSAKKPSCETCTLKELCEFYSKMEE